MNSIYHVGISGGKDSTALLLWMVYESGIPHTNIVATFCDTQNESDFTYQHVLNISRTVFPVIWIQSEGFLNLAIRKKRFPSTKARFCTQELKLKPTKAFIEELTEYADVTAVSGLRRDESAARANIPEWGSPLDSYFGIVEWRPLIDWTLDDVLSIHRKYNVELNPLYNSGARRVGCFPCINSSKDEIYSIARNYPERIDQIRAMEKAVSNRNGFSTFFSRNCTPESFRSKEIITASGEKMKVATIDDVVKWSCTGHRARGIRPEHEGLFDFKDHPSICLNQSLACE